MHVKNLECSSCHREYEARKPHNVCTECGKPLLVRYDLKRIAKFLTRQTLYARRSDMWRYREVLPVRRVWRSSAGADTSSRSSARDSRSALGEPRAGAGSR